MKKYILLVVVFAAFAVNSMGQNETNTGNAENGKKKCCFKISSLSIASGFNDYKTIGHGDKDWDMDKASKGQNGWQSGNMGFMMGKQGGNTNSRNQLVLEMGLTPFSKKLGDYNQKRELVIGLYYSGSNLEDRKTTDFVSTPGDTFSFNSVTYRTDTVTRMHRTFVEKANVLGASVSYLYKTDPAKRFSLFTGYGIDAGFAINGRTHETYTKDSVVQLSFYNTKPDYNVGFENGNFLGVSEQNVDMKADQKIFTSVFVPFGVNLRLCKAKDIWNQMNLFMRGSLGMEAEFTVKGEPHFNPYMGASLGFKFDFK